MFGESPESRAAYDDWQRKHALASFGWYVCEVDGRDDQREQQVVNGHVYGDRPYELQAVTDENVFADDDAAWRHVLRSAEAGDLAAIGALEFLRAWSPYEYAALERVRVTMQLGSASAS